jgi:uncharacterized protein YbjT (DUF2867 family)
VTVFDEEFNTRDPVHVVGAAGRIGQAVCRTLLALGTPVVPVVRDTRTWRETGLPGMARNADLLDAFSLRSALHDAVRVVSCASPHHTQAIVNATMPDTLLVLLGDARRYLHAPDRSGLMAMEGERVLLGSGRPGVMLHPTMIYGLGKRDPMQTLLRWMRRLPVLPLPEGGRVQVQPIALYDVMRAVLAALDRNWPQPMAFPIGGARSVPLAEFVAALAQAADVKMPPILALPRWLLPMLSPLGMLPFLPQLSVDDLRNLAEDRSVETMSMLTRLGQRPLTLQEGLTALFA